MSAAPRRREPRAGVGLRLLRAAVFTAVCVALSAAAHGMASTAPVPWWTLGVGCAGLFVVAVPLTGRSRSLWGISAVLAAGQLSLHTLFGAGQRAPAPLPTGTARSALVAEAARLVCGAGTSGLSSVQARHILAGAHLTLTGSGQTLDTLHRQSDAAAMATGGHAMDMPMLPLPDAMPLGGSGGSALMLPSLPMVLGHLLAALAAGWLLRRGDLAVLRLVALSVQGVAEAALIRGLRAALALVRALRAGLPGAPRTGARARRPRRRRARAPIGALLQHSVIRRGPPVALPGH